MERGDFDVAVTLAGAAEGMFGSRPGLWGYMMSGADAVDATRDELISFSNDLRDWLKHECPAAGQTRTITATHAALMIARAMSKLDKCKWSPAMTKFAGWYQASVETESFWEELQCTPPSSG